MDTYPLQSLTNALLQVHGIPQLLLITSSVTRRFTVLWVVTPDNDASTSLRAVPRCSSERLKTKHSWLLTFPVSRLGLGFQGFVGGLWPITTPSPSDSAAHGVAAEPFQANAPKFCYTNKAGSLVCDCCTRIALSAKEWTLPWRNGFVANEV